VPAQINATNNKQSSTPTERQSPINATNTVNASTTHHQYQRYHHHATMRPPHIITGDQYDVTVII
jgi:hypothetical protein